MEKRGNVKKTGNRERANFITGIRPVMEALSAGKEIEKALIQKGLTGPIIRELKTRLRIHAIPYQEVPVEKLNKLTRAGHQGVLAFTATISYASLDHIVTSSFSAGRSPRLIILDRVSDVGNFGAITRTAEGLGFDTVIIPSKGNAMINEYAMKSSAGALNHLPICRETHLSETVKYLKDCGIRIIACTEQAVESLYNCDLTGPIALLFGSEEDGISPELLRSADQLVKVPMRGKILSFNVSVTVAMVCAEVIRQSGD